MNGKIKAAFFDIDGTLLSHNGGVVPEKHRYALESLRKKGILIFTCTGRHILELDELGITELDFDGYVLLNGQICLDRERKLLSAFPIERADLENAFQIFQEKDLPTGFVEQNRIYINKIDERVRTAQKAISSKLPREGSWEGDPVYLVNVYADDADVNRVMEKMPHCKVTRWNSFGVDIIAQESGKVRGMEELLSHFGISRDEVIAFGDGENDLEMLSYAGIGVAMGNADERAKACADYVTSEADRGGILSALWHYGIL